MAQGSIADSEANGRGTGISGEVASRIRRGISLYSNMHQEIETQHAGIYRIPSSTGRGFYRVIVKQGEAGEAGESCNCPDRKGHELGICKHITAALIHDAKRPTYRIRKTSEAGDVFELLQKRAGIEEVIGWGTCSEMYWSKWALENPEWDWDMLDACYCGLERLS